MITLPTLFTGFAWKRRYTFTMKVIFKSILIQSAYLFDTYNTFFREFETSIISPASSIDDHGLSLRWRAYP